MRFCIKCKVEKPLSDFRDSKSAQCKACYHDYYRDYYAKNRERRREQMRQYRVDNRVKINATAQRWRYAHLDRWREISRKAAKKYYYRNQDAIIEYGRRYRQERKFDSFSFDHEGSDFFQRTAHQWSQDERVNIDDVLTELSDSERQYVERFLRDETPIPAAVLTSIRQRFLGM